MLENMQPIVFPVQFELPNLSLFDSVNTLISTLVFSWLLFSFIRNPWLLARPAFSFAGLINVIFQWPLVFLSDPIYGSLSNPWWFSLSAHATAVVALMWVKASAFLTFSAETIALRELKAAEVLLPALLASIFSLVYFNQVPIDCTALFAIFFDPAHTLLAREVTIKLAGSSLASSSFGAVANTVAPILAAISVAMIVQGIINKRISSLLWCAVLIFSLSIVMLAGAKGLLIPLIGVVSISAVLWSSGFWSRIFAGLASLALIFVALAAFELVRERGGGSKPYDFVECVRSVGSFEAGFELLYSIRERGGLGLSSSQVNVLISEMKAAQQKVKGSDGGVQRSFSETRQPDAGRAVTYLEAVLQRAFVSPLQVAAWHHLYVDEFGSPGLLAAPMAMKLFGESVDTSSLVYMAYGTIYSNGDRTSTSTAPSSFIFLWPAYFGAIGLFCSIISVLVLDGIFSALSRRASTALLPVISGIAVVIGFNMITSDYVVVMLSHGGAVAVFLLSLWCLIEQIDRRVERRRQNDGM